MRLLQLPELVQLLDSPALSTAEKFPLALIIENIARQQMLVVESALKFSHKFLKLTTYPLK